MRHPGGVGHGVGESERVGRLGGASRAPRPARLAPPGQHRGYPYRLVGQRSHQGRHLVVGGPAVDRQRRHRAGLAGRQHHLGDAVDRQVAFAAGDVAGGHFQQSRQQRRHQFGALDIERVEHAQGAAARVVGVQAPGVEDALLQEDRSGHLDRTGEGQRPAHRAAAALRGGEAATGGGGGQDGRDLLQALQPQYLLHQVGGLHQIGPPARRAHDELAVPGVADAHLYRAADLRQPPRRRPGRVGDARGPVGQVEIHPDRLPLGRRDPDVGEFGFHCATGDVGQQRGRAVQRRDIDLGIDGALEAPRRLRGQLVPPRGARDRDRVPGRGLQQDVGGVVADLGGRAAHDARERDDARVVGDHDVLGVQDALGVVEGAQRLARVRAPDHQATGDLGRVEGVQRLAQLQHHVVGDVDRRRDRPHARQQQPPLQPPRTDRRRIDAGHPPRGEPGAQRFGFQPHLPGVGFVVRQRTHGRIGVFEVEPAGQFARETAHREGVPAIRRDGQLDDRIVQAQDLVGVVTGLGRPRLEHQNPGMVLADTQFGDRADHAVGHVPVGLARADLEPAGQDAAGQHHDNEVTDREIGCAADDLLQLGTTDIDLAEPDRLLELGQLGDLGDPAHHQRPLGSAGDPLQGVDLLDLEADADESGVEFFRGHRPLRGGAPQDFGQPGLRYSHVTFRFLVGV